MPKTLHGVSVRDNYPDYPKDIADWKEWQVCENHEIGCRAALVKDGCMSAPKFQIRSWKKTTYAALEAEGHTSLSLRQCSCYAKWSKATRKTIQFFM